MIAAKFNHLKENSKLAFKTSKRTLYVVYADKLSDLPNGLTQTDFQTLLQALKLQRNDNFLLLVLVTDRLSQLSNFNFDVLIDGNLIFHLIKEFDNPKWHTAESINQWNEVLQLLW